MKNSLALIILLVGIQFHAQTIINGKVTNKKGVVIVGANIYLDGTYDGSTTDENGVFSFSYCTASKGKNH